MATRLPTRVLERIVRGVSCHRRIQILDLLDTSPHALSLLDITKLCRANLKVVCEHVRRLHIAGLITKRNKGNSVLHQTTPVGRRMIAFLRLVDPRAMAQKTVNL